MAIRWIMDGEPHAAEVYNRPLRDYIQEFESDVKVTDTKTIKHTGKGSVLDPLKFDVKLSPDGGNLIQERDGGLYYGVQAPDDVARLYIDAISGDDSALGTHTAPMKTIRAALARGPDGISRTIYLMENQIHDIDASNPANIRGGILTIHGYGPTFDNVPAPQQTTEGVGNYCKDVFPIIRPINPHSLTEPSGRVFLKTAGFHTRSFPNVIIFYCVYEMPVIPESLISTPGIDLGSRSYNGIFDSSYGTPADECILYASYIKITSKYPQMIDGITSTTFAAAISDTGERLWPIFSTVGIPNILPYPASVGKTLVVYGTPIHQKRMSAFVSGIVKATTVVTSVATNIPAEYFT